jgi:hypothetical protein
MTSAIAGVCTIAGITIATRGSSRSSRMGALAASAAPVDRAWIAVVAARHGTHRESILKYDLCARPANVDVACHECPGGDNPGSHGQRPVGNQDERGHRIAGAK